MPKSLSPTLCREYLEEYVFQECPKDYGDQRKDFIGTVGLEVEMLPIRKNDSPVPGRVEREVIADELVRVSSERGYTVNSEPPLIGDKPLVTLVIPPDGGSFSFEPGGQLEFSSMPFSCLADCIANVEKTQKDLRQLLAPLGITLTQIGVNPWHTTDEIGLSTPKRRYRAMDEYFQRISPMGRRMMRQTCTIQVCLDFGPSDQVMAERYLLGHYLAPFAASMFAFSPWIDGKPALAKGFRSNIWRNLDPSRCGFPKLDGIRDSLSKESCVASYLEFALNASVIFIQRLDYEVPPVGYSFKKWMLSGYKGVYPDIKDFITHLSLLFPEVRPKGFLELRSIDAQAEAWQELPAAFYTGLLYDPKASAAALSLLAEYHTRLPLIWERAMYGLDAELSGVCGQLLQFAAEGFARLPPCYQSTKAKRAFSAFRKQFIDRQRTPADDILGKIAEDGLGKLLPDHLEQVNDMWNQLIDHETL